MHWGTYYFLTVSQIAIGLQGGGVISATKIKFQKDVDSAIEPCPGEATHPVLR